ncbi:VacB/RNase II family 3'-5' exoribonuclease [Euhalothece natronophila Z-M001]|uniref:VacB/RNase II family 3'-5' exoribonuclease n=1 Tax=Euhalothece natronophila Z-M001 TaxID=522448 RepID=A0A5B8NJY1_9CHRO|nr:ribonuclease R family protein [Euhalothece natronophila]QDZ39552.1 VacB/RNase II family 3'-5' exoribonuclease [Euhalothece natronophila Z-M001]
MEFSIATILSHLSDNKLVAPKVLEKKLNLQEESSIQKLQIALDALERVGVIVKERGKYRRVPQDDVVEAKLRCSSKGFCFAIQDQEGTDDIYVRESYLGSAWNGDRVLVKVIKDGSRRRSPEGEVQVILDRANPSLLAQVRKVEDNSEKDYQAVPLDDRLLFELDLSPDGQDLESAVDHLVHLEVLRYPLGDHPPVGRVTKILGSDAEEAADTDIVCCKHDLPRQFSATALKEAKALTPTLDEKTLQKRVDYRDLFTVTLEETSENTDSLIENALTLNKTKEGNWELGIHIADIAHYVPKDSAMDTAAKQRGTAVFLNDFVIPLFPPEVQQCASLIPGEDRLAVSILLTLNSMGEIEGFEIQESVIRVDEQVSYQQAQSLLGTDNNTATAELLNDLFFNLSPVVKSQRVQRGGFEIELPEAQGGFKDEGRLGTVVATSSLPVRALLTELMILAGQAVGQHLQALGVPGIYRVQHISDYTEIEDLMKLGNNLGLTLELENEDELRPQDYQNFSQQIANSDASRVLMFFLKSTLKLAKYSTKPSEHFGLALNRPYSPCISPGRRYADLWNQRILKSVFHEGRDRRVRTQKEGVDLHSNTSHGKINWKVLPPAMATEYEEEIASFIHHLNERDKMVEDAENDLKGLNKAEKMKERTGEVFSGLITGVQSYGFFVEIEDLLVEGLVHVSSLKDDWYEYRARHACLVGRKNRIAYRLGSRVKVQVKSVDYYRQQIDLVTVSGATPATDEDLDS